MGFAPGEWAVVTISQASRAPEKQPGGAPGGVLWQRLEPADGGVSWSLTGEGLRAAFMPPDMTYNPIMQDPHPMVSCPAVPDQLWISEEQGDQRHCLSNHLPPINVVRFD